MRPVLWCPLGRREQLERLTYKEAAASDQASDGNTSGLANLAVDV